jgi:hypothetical protein
MKHIETIVISLVISLALILTAINIPVKFLSFEHWFGGNLGVGISLTDIQSSDTVSAYPTVQNANNAILETAINTIEGTTTNSTLTTLSGLTSAASLATVGALSSGSLTTGFTTINVAQGGTGSSTLSQFSVLLGSSTNAIDLVDGAGSSGQFLTSNGVGVKPSWQSSSVNQTSEYDWTGLHDFAASTTFNTATEAASSFFGKLFFKGVSTTTLDFTNTGVQASSTVPSVNGVNGAVSWVPRGGLLFTGATTTSVSSSASTTVLGITIPANTFVSGQPALVTGQITFEIDGMGDADDGFEIVLDYGGVMVATSSIGDTTNLSLTNSNSVMNFALEWDGTNQRGSHYFISEKGTVNGSWSATSQGIVVADSAIASVDVTADQTLSIIVNVMGAAGSFTFEQAYVELKTMY